MTKLPSRNRKSPMPKKANWLVRIFQRWLGDDVLDHNITLTYTVTFERVGRNRNVKPLTTTARDADELAEKIYDHARPHLGSQAVHVDVDLDELRGFIMAGFRDAGRFTITAGGGSR